jgi:putative membrane protein
VEPPSLESDVPDLLLTFGHHLGVFSLLAILVAELVLLCRPVGDEALRALARLDIAYGLTAAAILAIGFGRVFFGAKDSAFFLENPVFWTKIGLFALIGAISAVPTVRFIRWRRRVRAQGELPTAGEVAAVRRLVIAEVALFVPLPLLAAAMVRGFGLH